MTAERYRLENPGERIERDHTARGYALGIQIGIDRSACPISIAEERQAFLGNLADCHLPGSRQPVAGMADEHELVAVERFYVLDFLSLRDADAQVQCSRCDSVYDLSVRKFADLKVDRGVIARKCSEDRRQVQGIESLRHTEVKTPAFQPAVLYHGVAKCFNRAENDASVLDYQRTGFGNLDPPCSPVEQSHAEFEFEIAYLLRQRWLGDVQRLGRAREVMLVRHANDEAEAS